MLLSTTQPKISLFASTAAIPAHDPTLFEWPPPAPYSNIVKDLGEEAAASLDACQAACIAYRNTKVSPVSGWERCMSFTHLDAAPGQPSRCVAVVDAEEWAPVSRRGAVAGRLEWPPQTCATDADCSLNGVCATDKRCKCADAWTGDRCQTLALEPTTVHAGLRMTDASGANTSSWGGAVLLDAASSPPMYHMWASEMGAGCGIEAWRSNSRIVHATSTDGVRFERKEVVFERFAHEPTVARAPTGEWVVWFTGDPEGASPPPLCTECAGGNTLANTSCATGYTVNGPTYLSWASAPEGPWSKPQRLFAAQANQTNLDTNLAATILSNGSVVGIGRNGGDPTGILAHLVTAESWRDPSSYVGRWEEMLFPNTTRLDYAGVEDPYVWVDPTTETFHAIFHSQIENDDERLCGGHAFSADGVSWTFGGTAFSNRVRFTAAAGSAAAAGSTTAARSTTAAASTAVPSHGDVGVDGASSYEYRFSRRERPHLVFDARGAITALTTGVQFGRHSPTSVAGEDACYTLLQPVRTSTSTHASATTAATASAAAAAAAAVAADAAAATSASGSGSGPSRPPCNADLSCDLSSASAWRCGHDPTLQPSAENNCHLGGPGAAGNSSCSCGAMQCQSTPSAPTNASSQQYLMIGDSVSIGTAPLVFANLTAHAIEATHSPGNAASTNLGAHCLDAWTDITAGRRWDLISFQFGLHDIAYDTERIGVEQYRALLENITARLVAIQRRDTTQLLWVTTTPVPTVPTYSDAGPCNATAHCLNPPRIDADVQLYNEAAAQVMAAANAAGAKIATLDLYSLVLARCGGPGYKSCDGFQLPANVHYTAEGWQALADATVDKVLGMLPAGGGVELVEA